MMLRTKRIIITAVLVLSCAGALFAQAKKNARVGVFTPEVEGSVSSIDSTLLKGAVKDKIESNFKKYTDFTVVSTNSTEIKNLQKETQTTGMDKNTAIRMGKIMSADSALNTVIRKNGSGYVLSVKYIDLTTGEILASVQQSASNGDSLWSGAGCAVDLITVDLCDTLKIPLSPAQRYVLKNGEKDMSVDEQVAMYKADTERYKQLISNYDKEINSLSLSTDVNAKEKQIAIQAQKEIAEQKLKSSMEAQKRYEDLQAQKREEEMKEADRSQTQKQKRAEIEKQAMLKAQQVIQEKKSNASIIQAIGNIENEKRAYIEIKQNLEFRIIEIQNECRKEKLNIEKEIRARPYPKALLDKDGNPIAEAERDRAKEVSKIQLEMQDRADEEIQSVKDTIEPQLTNLLALIYQDTAALEGKRHVSSVSDDLSIVVGLYDGNKREWTAHLYYNVDGIDIFQKELSLSYEKVTGEKVKNVLDQSYIDNVDLYDSLFSRGTPIIIFDLEYSVKALPKNHPSEYEFTFYNLSFKDARKNLEVIDTMPVKGTQTFRLTPAYDIRTESDLKAEAEESRRQAAIQKEIDEKNFEEQRKREKKEERKRAKFGNNARTSYTISAELPFDLYRFDSQGGFSIEYDRPVAGPLFYGASFAEFDDFNSMNGLGYVGLNLGGKDFAVYGKVGAGYGFDYLGDSGVLLRSAFGIDIWVFEVEYSIDYIFGGYFNDRITAGLSFRK